MLDYSLSIVTLTINKCPDKKIYSSWIYFEKGKTKYTIVYYIKENCFILEAHIVYTNVSQESRGGYTWFKQDRLHVRIITRDKDKYYIVRKVNSQTILTI